MSTRSYREHKIYSSHLKNIDKSICAFCAIESGDEQLIKSTKSFKIIKNIFSYSIWDSQKVVDHLMVVPKAHTDNLANMTPKQAAEYLLIISEYEQRGYNIYARAPSTKTKSIIHQHTHLIKVDGKFINFSFWIKKPFFIRLTG